VPVKYEADMTHLIRRVRGVTDCVLKIRVGRVRIVKLECSVPLDGYALEWTRCPLTVLAIVQLVLETIALEDLRECMRDCQQKSEEAHQHGPR
jgi:hypothetical protein